VRRGCLKAKVLLGSATSIETYFNGKSGKYFSRNQSGTGM
jgi:hypothetical protein